MRCVLCKSGEVRPATVQAETKVGPDRLLIRVEAEVCPECGEAYYSPEALRTLEKIREDFARKAISPASIGKVYQVDPDALRGWRERSGDFGGKVSGEDWARLQTSVNTCRTCLSEVRFEPVTPPPGRPWSPVRPGRLLLIAEAPPLKGGFWRPDVRDDLREYLLALLHKQGLQVPKEIHSKKALKAFLSGGFFLVHALKWPFAARNGKRPSYNRGLTSREQRRLVDHSVSAHLRDELRFIAPRGILAMGNAAWRVSMELSDDPLSLLKTGRVETLRCKRPQKYEIVLGGVSTPVNVTLLPVGQNMRDPRRRNAIEEDILEFLRRHKWSPVQSWPIEDFGQGGRGG